MWQRQLLVQFARIAYTTTLTESSDAALEDLTSGNQQYKEWSEAQRALKVTERETRKISRALNAIINGLAGTKVRCERLNCSNILFSLCVFCTCLEQ